MTKKDIERGVERRTSAEREREREREREIEKTENE